MASRHRRATLANVAASAGVSVATVSKVLNDRNDVAPATRALVQEHLHEHDYVARRAKPALSPAPAIELFFHGQLNAYHTEVLQGVVEAATEAGVAVVVSVRPREQPSSGANRPAAWARGLAAAGRQGAIVVTSELAAAELRALTRARMPVVVIDPLNLPSAQVTSVGSTNFAGGLAATQPASMQENANPSGTPGNTWWTRTPAVPPMNNEGKMGPPMNPLPSLTAKVNIFAIKTATSKPTPRVPASWSTVLS